jgi:fructose-1,6-bisphosphatase/inositol monophosphatase family enzyme
MTNTQDRYHIDSQQASRIDAILRDVARRELLPRFGHLAPRDIIEKAPGDVVTVADRNVESALAAELTKVVPGSVVVGEEACADDPDLTRLLDGTAPVWIIDPIDGTHNFVAGGARFATLVTLAHNGQLVASWIYAPLLDLMATATADNGAYLNGNLVQLRPTPSPVRYLDIAIPDRAWWPADQIEHLNTLTHHAEHLSIMDTAALEYVRMTRRRRAAIISTWDDDHTAGILLHAEAGGVTLTRDGTPFRLTGDNALPLVSAPDLATAIAIHAAMTQPHQPSTPPMPGQRPQALDTGWVQRRARTTTGDVRAAS